MVFDDSIISDDMIPSMRLICIFPNFYFVKLICFKVLTLSGGLNWLGVVGTTIIFYGENKLQALV